MGLVQENTEVIKYEVRSEGVRRNSVAQAWREEAKPKRRVETKIHATVKLKPLGTQSVCGPHEG